MISDQIKYKKRRKYKYNLHSDSNYPTGIKLAAAVDGLFIVMSGSGDLIVRSGYSWDGPSGPTFDTPSFMRGSLVHDALYQLIRERKLPVDSRKRADKLLKEICVDDGMWRIKAEWVYYLVRLFGASAAEPDMLDAPSGA